MRIIAPTHSLGRPLTPIHRNARVLSKTLPQSTLLPLREKVAGAKRRSDEGCAELAVSAIARQELPEGAHTARAALAKVAALAIASALLTAPALATDYPLTIENCGATVTFTAPPERVVTIKSTATEMLLALGLGDKIVGVGFQDGPVPEEWAPETELPVLAERVPSQEVVLEAEPDFIYGGWESSFAADAAGERDSLHALGIATYVAPTACRSTGTPEKLSFEDIFDQIIEMGAIFDVEDRAAELVDQQRALLAEIKPVSELTGVWYSSATSTPYVGAGLGGPQTTMDALGITNIFSDVPDTWTSASWEAIVDQNPDVMILVDAEWNSVDQKIRLLNDNPATANMSAVQNARYLTIPFPAAEPGVRSVPATVDLANQLTGLELTSP